MAVTRRHQTLFLAASFLTYLLVTLGGIVCVTDSSGGCPDWPGCYGRLVPPLRLDSILEYTHRVLAALVTLLIVASAVVGRRHYRASRWLSRPPAIAIGFLLAVIVFGAMVILRGLEPGLAALDLGSALVVLALMLAATVVAVARHRTPDLPDRLSFDGALSRLALVTLIAVFVVLVSGVLVAESGSMVRCLGWPLFGGPVDLAGARGWLDGARRVAGGLAALLIVALVVRAWRPTRASATALGVAFGLEMALGAAIVATGGSMWLYVLYAAAAVALWAGLVVLVVGTALQPSRSS